MLGVWSDATDGYDSSYDNRLTGTGDDGYAGVYHINQLDGWTGPTGFYKDDMRSRPGPNDTKVWQPIHLWADPNYADPTMTFAMLANEFMEPPNDREYTLRLLYVPKGVVGAPAVGTTWSIPSFGGEYLLTLPTFSTANGLEGYQFAFEVSAVVPEPGTLAAVVAILGIGVRGSRVRRPKGAKIAKV